MKFHTKAKYRMPTTLIEHLLENFTLPTPPADGWQRVGGRRSVQVPENTFKDKSRSAPAFTRNTRGATQLVMSIEVVLPNGDVRDMRVLIDTGAECNLIKKDLYPTT